MSENPQDTYYADMQEEVPESQALSDYTPRTIASEIQFTDELINVVLPMNAERFMKINSALATGAWWSFPQEWLEIMAWFWQAMEVAMTCQDVQDCIETNEGVLEAILAQLAANGFAPSQNSPENTSTNVTMSPSQSAENLLPTTISCSEGELMSIARGVVRQFNQASEDFFDAVEFNTNAVEAGNILSDGVPVAGTLNNVTELADWLIQTMRESYQASYNFEVETELACALFCEMLPECELTYDMILSVYENFASAEYGAPTDLNDFQSIADWALGLSLVVSTGTVATFHYMMALAMKFGSGTVFQMAGLTSLKTILASLATYNDTSWTECECAEETPLDYWYISFNFELGQLDTILQTGTPGVFTENGYEGRGNLCRVGFQYSLGSTTVYLAHWRVTSLRRGSNGNGTNDFTRLRTNPNADYSGTWTTITNISSITCNDNDCTNENVGNYTDNTTPAKAIEIASQVNGVYAEGVEMVRLYKAEFWGYNHGDIKPPQAVWVDTLP